MTAGLSGSAEAQRRETITPAVCVTLDDALGSAIPPQRNMARSIETMQRAMAEIAPSMEGRARLQESNRALTAASQELLGSTKRMIAAMEDFQAQLRECGRG